jgi:uncharacterized membrane protein YphA (DoxX/SURF4 family)
MDAPTLITFFSGVSFLIYGTSCLFAPHMRKEFARFGYPRQRVLTGILQLLGALGLIIGYFFQPLIALSAAMGLTLMMAFGFYVRLSICDHLYAASPALIYALLNLYLSVHYYQQLTGV